MLQSWHWAVAPTAVPCSCPRQLWRGELDVRLVGKWKRIKSKPCPKDRGSGSHSVAVLHVESPRKQLPVTDRSQSGPQARRQRWHQGSLLAFFHFCLGICFLMVRKLLDSLAAVEELIAHVEEKQWVMIMKLRFTLNYRSSYQWGVHLYKGSMYYSD